MAYAGSSNGREQEMETPRFAGAELGPGQWGILSQENKGCPMTCVYTSHTCTYAPPQCTHTHMNTHTCTQTHRKRGGGEHVLGTAGRECRAKLCFWSSLERVESYGPDGLNQRGYESSCKYIMSHHSGTKVGLLMDKFTCRIHPGSSAEPTWHIRFTCPPHSHQRCQFSTLSALFLIENKGLTTACHCHNNPSHTAHDDLASCKVC